VRAGDTGSARKCFITNADRARISGMAGDCGFGAGGVPWCTKSLLNLMPAVLVRNLLAVDWPRCSGWAAREMPSPVPNRSRSD
jgi:hypothetical protein